DRSEAGTSGVPAFSDGPAVGNLLPVIQIGDSELAVGQGDEERGGNRRHRRKTMIIIAGYSRYKDVIERDAAVAAFVGLQGGRARGDAGADLDGEHDRIDGEHGRRTRR